MQRLNLDLEEAQQRRERMLAQIDAVFANVTPNDMPAEVAQWCDLAVSGERRSSLLLMGPTGTGKTHTALAVTMWLFEATHLAPRIVTATAMLKSLQPGGGATVDRYTTSTQLLVLDDLGAAKITGFKEEATLEVIDQRYRHRLPTIVTTNLPGDEMSEVLGDRVVSRLRGMCDTVVFRNKDRRQLDHPPIYVDPTNPNT